MSPSRNASDHLSRNHETVPARIYIALGKSELRRHTSDD